MRSIRIKNWDVKLRISGILRNISVNSRNIAFLYFTKYLNENCNFKYSCYLVMDWIIPKLNFEPSQTPPKSQNFEPVQKILTKIKSL